MGSAKTRTAEVIIIGGGLAGLSAAIYLGRAQRETLVVHEGKSMARWEPDVQNYLGFPAGIGGSELLRRGRKQAQRYGTRFARDSIQRVSKIHARFSLRGKRGYYSSKYLLIATGIFHIPPSIPGLAPCLGHSFFFCKDCDGYRVQQKQVAVYGWTNQTVHYALGLLEYSPLVFIVTDGHPPAWDKNRKRWIKEYRIPVHVARIQEVMQHRRQIEGFRFDDGSEALADALFATRGDIYHNRLAQDLGARINSEGEILVDEEMRTTVSCLYAAGCVTPANCQMIIAAGQGATAAQSINRRLLDDSIRRHELRRFRWRQIRLYPRVTQRIRPAGLTS